MGFLLGGAQAQGKTRPQFTGLQVQTSAFGVTITILFGQARIAPNLIWYGDFKAIKHQAGGKGGVMGAAGKSGGGVTYTYQTAIAMGLCEGPVTAIGRVWQSKAITTLAKLGLALFQGTAAQAPWGYLTTNHAGQDLTYTRLAYLAAAPFQLGSSANLDSFTFEATGLAANAIAGKPDADPAVVIQTLLSSAIFGLGLAAARIGDMSSYSNYCRAVGMVISPAFTDQQSAADIIANVAKLTNSAPVWSSGKLQIVPYGDQSISANGAVYTAPSAPLYDLTTDHFISQDGGAPVKVRRKRPADAFNVMSIEFLNRANEYNPEPADAKDQNAIELFGRLPADPVSGHIFCDKDAATQAARLMLGRENIRNEYTFTLGDQFIELDPMDIVTLTEANAELAQQWVRITDIEEDVDGNLTVTAEEYLAGTAAAPLYGSQAASRSSLDFNVAPGPINPPLIFEPPLALLTLSDLEVWLAVSGTTNWGGCDVWLSTDGTTYAKIEKVTQPARQGVLTGTLAVPVSAPDIANTLAIDVTQSLAELLSGSQADVDALNTVCYVDGELIAYRDALLTSAFHYNLTYLIRGAYNSTIGAHGPGTAFARLDDTIIKVPFTDDRIGSTVYLKFTSFNIYGGAEEDLAGVTAYAYTIGGGSVSAPLPNPTNLRANFIGGVQQIHWTAITDLRSPIDYEVRRGLSFTNSMVLGRTPDTTFETQGDGTYWVSARFVAPTGVSIYSSAPPSIVIAGSILVSNVIATWDEQGTDWPGTVSGGAIVSGTAPGRVVKLTFSSSTDILSDPNILLDTDILGLGGIAPTGTYTAPSPSHRITIPTPAPCQVSMIWQVFGESIYSDVLGIVDVLTDPDILDSALGALVSAQPQIRLSLDGGVSFGAWQDFSPGTYIFNAIEARMNLSTSDPTVSAVLTAWSWSADVPDRLDTALAIPVLAAGMTFVFQDAYPTGSAKPFNAKPLVQVLVLDAVQGDDVILPDANITAAQCTFQIVNAGVGVSRNVNITAQGY